MNRSFLALNSSSLAVCRAVSRELPAGDVPDRIMIIPAGTTTGVDGRTFELSDPTAVVARFKGGARALPIDIEHCG